MLKIKDEVDLKELERFGFKYIENKKLPQITPGIYKKEK